MYVCIKYFFKMQMFHNKMNWLIIALQHSFMSQRLLSTVMGSYKICYCAWRYTEDVLILCCHQHTFLRMMDWDLLWKKTFINDKWQSYSLPHTHVCVIHIPILLILLHMCTHVHRFIVNKIKDRKVDRFNMSKQCILQLQR